VFGFHEELAPEKTVPISFPTGPAPARIGVTSLIISIAKIQRPACNALAASGMIADLGRTGPPGL